MTIGEALKKIRTQRGISAKQLSTNLGFYKSYISKIECNEIIPSDEKLLKIFEYLKIPNELISLLILKDEDFSESKKSVFNNIQPILLDLLIDFSNKRNPINNITEENIKITALIMKGGGIKGLAYIGALEELEKYYNFNWFTGTSAGAISAVLLGCGYETIELKDILFKKNFKDFKDAIFPITLMNLLFYGGLYKAESFTNWLSTLLASKLNTPTDVKLKDLKYRTTIYASKKNDTALIFDSKNNATYNQSASFAVRCSMSIPFIFAPQKEQGLNIYDGGLQNNYPVNILLDENPDIEFVGLYLGNPIYDRANNESGIFSDLFSIWTEANDIVNLREHIENTIIIDPNPISTLDFSLSKLEKFYLINSGKLAAKKFLQKKGRATFSSEELSNDEINLEKIRKKIKVTRKLKKAVKYALISSILIITIYFLF